MLNFEKDFIKKYPENYRKVNDTTFEIIHGYTVLLVMFQKYP